MERKINKTGEKKKGEKEGRNKEKQGIAKVFMS